jgi:hypothetical protein
MDISKFDVTILVVMGLAVVSMSFVMPALGLTNLSAEETSIPELSIDSERFSVSQERPDFPNTATEGTIELNETQDSSLWDNQLWLDGNTEGGYELAVLGSTTSAPNSTSVILNEWNSTSQVENTSTVVINESNQREALTTGEYRLIIEATEDNNPPDYHEVSWEIIEQPQVGGSWVDRIPGVGGLFSTADAIASVIAWAVTVFIWFSTNLVFAAVNLVGIIIDVSVYFLSLLAWLGTRYGTVVSSAPSWVAVFVAIPGILLGATLGKVVIILFRSLPTT